MKACINILTKALSEKLCKTFIDTLILDDKRCVVYRNKTVELEVSSSFFIKWERKGCVIKHWKSN